MQLRPLELARGCLVELTTSCSARYDATVRGIGHGKTGDVYRDLGCARAVHKVGAATSAATSERLSRRSG